MPITTLERKNRSGDEPERLDTTIERAENIPSTTDKINHLCHCITPCLACFCREGGKE